MSLFKHHPHPYKPVNVNDQHAEEQTGFNQRIAVWITKGFGSMPAAYVLAIWMSAWMFLAGINFWLFSLDHYPYPFLLFCSNIVQLLALPIIMVGQNVLSRKAELMAEETYQASSKSFHDVEQIMQHLDTQDTVIIKQGEEILRLTKMTEEQTALLIQLSQKKK